LFDANISLVAILILCFVDNYPIYGLTVLNIYVKVIDVKGAG